MICFLQFLCQRLTNVAVASALSARFVKCLLHSEKCSSRSGVREVHHRRAVHLPLRHGPLLRSKPCCSLWGLRSVFFCVTFRIYVALIALFQVLFIFPIRVNLLQVSPFAFTSTAFLSSSPEPRTDRPKPEGEPYPRSAEVGKIVAKAIGSRREAAAQPDATPSNVCDI